jgi:predicted nucleic acid-binding protein
VGLSAITVAQLESGARNSGDYASGIVAVRKVLTPFQMWDFDATEAAEHSGVVRHGLETGAPPLAPWIF